VQALIPAALRRPHATYLYGIEVWRPLRATALTALRRAKLLLSCSHYTERRARECFPDLPAVSVVPLALAEEPPAGNLDLALLSRLPQTYFLVVGRMHPKERYKGHDLVLEALARLRSRGLAERCVIVGEGSDRARIQGRARDLGLADLVQFVGAVSDVTRDRLYARCRALVLPSTEEGFGLVYLEAMRAGRPCVAARGGAPEEIVRESSTGLLVSPRDPEELSAALARLGRDAGLAEELGKAGRGRWLACYTEDRFRARFYPEIDRLLGDVSS
jgi:glycosyltransferase involved in cell wall biosynthesis